MQENINFLGLGRWWWEESLDKAGGVRGKPRRKVLLGAQEEGSNQDLERRGLKNLYWI